MKANEILKAVNMPKSKYNTVHASKLSKVYDLLKEIKKDIIKAEIVSSEVVLYFGKHTEIKYKFGEWVEDTMNYGTEMKADIFKVETAYSSYSFAVPVQNNFYLELCTLLDIEAKFEPLKCELKPFMQIVTYPEILDAIKKAAKFVSKDYLRPSMQHICFDFSNKGLQIVATDTHRLYYSHHFNGEVWKEGFNKYIDFSICDPFQLLLTPESIKTLCSVKPDYNNAVEINCYEGGKATFNGIAIEFETEFNYVQYKVVIPEYKTKMQFNRKQMIESVTTVSKSANKSTEQVNFHLNGNIQLSAQDVDFGYESSLAMPYISKDFKDTDIAFNGRFMVEALKAFNSTEISMYSEGIPTKASIFTDGSDNVLLMPLLMNN